MRIRIRSIFRPRTLTEVLSEQLAIAEVKLVEHEQAINYSRALATYNRAEIARIKAHLTVLSKPQEEQA